MPSFASHFTQQPYPLPAGALWISQVPAQSLYTCHGLITPLVRCSLTFSYGCFAWTSTALQASSTSTHFFGAIPTLQEHGTPYGLYNSLSTLHVVCSSDCVLTQESFRDPQTPQNAQDSIRVARLNLSRQGLSPCKIRQAFLSH